MDNTEEGSTDSNNNSNNDHNGEENDDNINTEISQEEILEKGENIQEEQGEQEDETGSTAQSEDDDVTVIEDAKTINNEDLDNSNVLNETNNGDTTEDTENTTEEKSEENEETKVETIEKTEEEMSEKEEEDGEDQSLPGLLSTGVKKNELLTSDGTKYNYCFPSSQEKCDGPFAMARCAEIRKHYGCKRMKRGCKYRYKPRENQCCLLYLCVDGGKEVQEATEVASSEVEEEEKTDLEGCILLIQLILNNCFA